MVTTAVKNPSTVNFAKLVEKEWVKYWLDEKYPPQHAFQFLKLHMATLSSPKFKEWEKYLDALCFAGTKNPSTEELATNLQSALITKWIAEKKDPTDLKLKLNGVPTSDEMIERYVKALSRNTN